MNGIVQFSSKLHKNPMVSVNKMKKTVKYLIFEKLVEAENTPGFEGPSKTTRRTIAYLSRPGF